MQHAGTLVAPIHGGSYLSVFLQLSKEVRHPGFCKKIDTPRAACSALREV